MMVFNWSTRLETIVFGWWTAHSLPGFLLSLFVCILLGLLFQCLHNVRMAMEYQDSLTGYQALPTFDLAAQMEQQSLKPWWTRSVEASVFGLQAWTSAIIMLIWMTFNGWLIMATVWGMTFGYFLLGRGQMNC